jgi:glycosyltransferase involved in cell wall biosynthesis
MNSVEASADILLSIVIPTRNRSKYLFETLNNIFNNLKVDIELIVVDGNSIDDTQFVVESFINNNYNIRYFKLTDGKGFDFELDFGIRQTKSLFCWMFSDDDIIEGKNINIIYDLLSTLLDKDLVLLNSSIWNSDFTKQIKSRFLDFDKISGYGSDELFNKFIDYLSFFGGCIIKRTYWIQSEPAKYFGSLFVHIGVIFSKSDLKWYWYDKPVIQIRYGNASWFIKSLKVWLILWPNLLMSLKSIKNELILKKIKLSPTGHFKKFLYFKAIGVYDKKDAQKVYKTYQNFSLKIIILIIDFIPRKICYYFSFIFAFILKKETLLYDLKVNN